MKISTLPVSMTISLKIRESFLEMPQNLTDNDGSIDIRLLMIVIETNAET